LPAALAAYMALSAALSSAFDEKAFRG